MLADFKNSFTVAKIVPNTRVACFFDSQCSAGYATCGPPTFDP